MKRYIGLIAASAVGILLMVFGVYFQDAEPVNAAEWMRLLSNAALVPGVLLCGFGVLARIAGEGLFDGLKYTVGSIWTHVRGGKLKYDSYYEYTKRDRKEQSVGFMLVPGGVFLALAVAFTAAYYLV